MAGNKIKFSAELDDKVSGKLAKIRDEFDRLGGKGSAASLFGNVGAMAVAKGFSLIAEGAGAAFDVLKDAVRLGIEGEASIAKLTTSLHANVPAWDGQTAAIENVIKAQTDLGFSDIEQRDSLALLVAATHDITKAQTIQRTAMDLARFKGISLADATQALTKVEAGSYRILKSLGIVLKDGATQQDALTAVQHVAEGQAADYATTIEGKLLVAQTKWNDSLERIGETTLPLLSSALSDVSFAIDLMSGQLDTSTPQGLQKTQSGFIDLFNALGTVLPQFAALSSYMQANVPKIAATTDTATGKMKDDLAGLAVNFRDVGQAGRDAGAGVKSGASTAITWIEKWMSANADLLAQGQLEASWPQNDKLIQKITKHAKGKGPLQFDTGGMVPGPVGAPVRAIVHGGERVLTRAQQQQAGFTIQGFTERQIVDMVDRGLYFKLQRAAPTIGRT